jgi:type VI secretion system protein ImpK
MRLSDCFMEMIAYTAFFLKHTTGGENPPYEQVRGNLMRMIGESEARFQQARFSQDDYNLARFAVFAWIDEAVMASQWQGRTQWQREQLQRRYYQVTDAGEIFFERLNGLGAHQRDVREVYYLCLSLGFTGQYCNDGDDFLLEQLRTSNLKLLTGSTMGLPALDKENLFPAAYPQNDGTRGGRPHRRWSPFTLVAGVGPVVLFALLYVAYRFILHNIGHNLIGTVP